MLKEEGELLALQDRPQEGYESSLRALNFYLEAALEKDTVPEPELCARVDELCSRLENYALPEDTLFALFDFAELREAIPQAEDLLDRLGRIPGLEEEARQERIAFYQRLLDKPPADLARIGTSPDQLKARLTALWRKR
jgi:hypothetical protein